MTATFIGSPLSGQSLRNYISPVSTFYALVLVGSQCHVILSDFWANRFQITSLFLMSIHLNVYQAFSSPKYFQSNWVPIVFGFQQKTIWLIVFVALHVTVIQARVWFHCVHFFCPHTTIWLIVTPKQTWTFKGKIKISLDSRCFFCHIVTLSNRFEVWSKIIQRQAKSIFIAFGYDWNFGGDRNPIKFPGSGKAQIGPTAIRQM